MEAELAEWLQQEATQEVATGEARDSKPTYAAPLVHVCRYVHKNRVVRTLTGEEATSTSNLLIDGEVAVGARDRWTVPSGEQLPVLAVEQHPDELGAISHTRVFF